MTAPRFSDAEPLTHKHVLVGFDCGVPELNLWLMDHAVTAGEARSARTYVTVDAEQERVVGYHALAAASVSHEDAGPRARKGLGRHPVPAILLARLAVDVSVSGRGLGAFLLGDAMARACAASEEIGARLLLVHARDEQARGFDQRWGFEPSPTDELTLQLLIKDVIRSLRTM